MNAGYKPEFSTKGLSATFSPQGKEGPGLKLSNDNVFGDICQVTFARWVRGTGYSSKKISCEGAGKVEMVASARETAILRIARLRAGVSFAGQSHQSAVFLPEWRAIHPL